MRVLWFPGNCAIYANDNKYNGGGWTGALAGELIAHHPDLELGMAIPWPKEMKDVRNGVIFYGIPNVKYKSVNYWRKVNKQIQLMKLLVDDFKPDVIHVFGSEHTGGLVATVTNTPTVLHLQGILNFLGEAWLPYDLSWEKWFFWHPKWWLGKRHLNRCQITELRIFQACHNYMGRTDMDKRCVQLLSPNYNYYYCSEMLRPEIYHSTIRWSFHDRDSKILVSIISPAIFKGGDIILRTAKILKEYAKMKYVWYVYGIDNLNDWERLTGISKKDVNVIVKGVINAEQLIKVVTNADVYIHPSYVENSPNTICEAQVLGIPVVAHYTGGIPTLVRHLENGVLVPINNPLTMASYIQQLSYDKQLACRIGESGRDDALLRHRPTKIVEDVMHTYCCILKK